MKDILILGGGLSGISTAFFLQKEDWVHSITILEKEHTPGGLCKSLHVGEYVYDVGPHIIFSKDKEMLELLLDVVGEYNSLKRSNQIYYQGRLIQYPFENDLSKLPPEELEYCIQSFNQNPYENYDAENMIQFFLKTFGEGITNTYLRPYNEKIWKYDLAFMNTAMVDRIPKPTKDEIRRSAAGETIDGYLHQLYFSYPSEGGIESVIKGFLKQLGPDKCKILSDAEVLSAGKDEEKYVVGLTDGQRLTADLMVSTIPIQQLVKAWDTVPDMIDKCTDGLRYNSIIIAFVRTPYDHCGENYTFTVPDKGVLFHRISKMDFLGPAYHHGDEATFMVEVTYRKGDYVSILSENELKDRIRQGMAAIGFADSMGDVEILNVTKHEYAYVIYDLHHADNMAAIREYFRSQGVFLNGRFGNFEYWNMDRILRESLELSKKLSKINQ